MKNTNEDIITIEIEALSNVVGGASCDSPPPSTASRSEKLYELRSVYGVN